jgi:hypothetical protein
VKLILEGCDNSGKTSLANSLVAVVGDLRYFHPGGRPTDFSHEVRCMAEQYELLSTTGNIVIDRVTSISQQVYNPDESHNDLRMSEREAILALNPVIVYCRPSTDRLLRTQDLTWRDDESEEHKQKIIRHQHEFVKRYDEMFAKIPCISYDYEDVPHREVIFNKLVKAFKGSREDQQWFNHIMYMRSGR